MSENIFSAVLTFSLLAAGTVAIGSEMVAPREVAAKTAAVATLPPATVIGKRVAVADADSVTLPMVIVTRCRHGDTTVAVDDSDAAARRIQ